MKILHAITLFATLGLAFAKEFFLKIGLQADMPTIGALGLAITTLLVFRSIYVVASVAIIVVLISLPPEMLSGNNLDHDMLLAVALTIIVFPWLHKAIKEG